MTKESYKQQATELRVKAESALSRIDWAMKSEDVAVLIQECKDYIHRMGLAKRAYLLEVEKENK